jgi:single-stranded-DNA-specific exonuclease
MADLEGLKERLASAAASVVRMAEERKRILIATHIDADGLCSGSAVFSALSKKGANVTLRALPDLDPDSVQKLASEKFDFYVFTDLASGLMKELGSTLEGRFLVVDHHQYPEEDRGNPSVVNAWDFGFDGGKEACSSSMACMFAEAVDPSNKGLAHLGVVGALADRQDTGEGRSLMGVNRWALEEAVGAGLVSVSKDLLFTGRETRPIHEAVALTSTPHLPGITGAKDAVLAALHSSGLQLKDRGAWRTISSLSPEEKGKVTEVIAGRVGGQDGATEALASLVGEVYTLDAEDPYTPLRDAREFGTLLNSCGRMGVTGTGVAICLGDRSGALKEATASLSEYRSSLSKALDAVNSDPSLVEPHGDVVFVKGEGVVDEKMLGPVISILTSSPPFSDKVVVGRSSSPEGKMKVSSRVGDSYPGVVNLATVMREAAQASGGVGGGHEMAAGAKIPASRKEEFTSAVLKLVQK